jgi:anti-sigma B factor antagonist
MSLSEYQPRYFDVSEHDDVVVATFSMIQINDEANIEELGHELFALVDQFDCHKVVLNLSGVEYITSSVVGKIITMHRKLHRMDGNLIVSELTKGVHDVLSASRLLTYFVVTETQAEAVDSLRAAPLESDESEPS